MRGGGSNFREFTSTGLEINKKSNDALNLTLEDNVNQFRKDEVEKFDNVLSMHFVHSTQPNLSIAPVSCEFPFGGYLEKVSDRFLAFQAIAEREKRENSLFNTNCVSACSSFSDLYLNEYLHWGQSENSEVDERQDSIVQAVEIFPQFDRFIFREPENPKISKVSGENNQNSDDQFESRLIQLDAKAISSQVNLDLGGVVDLADRRQASVAERVSDQSITNATGMQPNEISETASMKKEFITDCPSKANSISGKQIPDMIVFGKSLDQFDQMPHFQKYDRFYSNPIKGNLLEGDVQRSIITLEAFQDNFEVKFISSSKELNDVLVRNQNELRASFRLLGLDEYTFSFLNEDFTKYRPLSECDVDLDANDVPSVEVLELYENIGPVLGVDKRI